MTIHIGRRRNANLAAFVTVVVAAGFALPTSANDRPKDPFGNSTTELDKGLPSLQYGNPLESPFP